MIEQIGKACCGCSACSNTCPKHCIQMTADEEGFLYPRVNKEVCVQCGLCQSVCPILHIDEKQQEHLQEAWGVITKDSQTLLESSSGGLFTALAQAVLSEGGCVCGAAFTQSFQSVHHIVVEKNDSLSALRGSKYMQSELGNVYQQIQQQLKRGRFVLFVGTPCQVAGLKHYIGHNDDHLILADVICHGTPSALLWQYYLQHIETKLGGSAKTVSFRNKRNGWQKYGLAVSAKNGKVYYRSISKDPYLKMFLRNSCLRESCYACKIKEKEIVSDLTIGDFWGVKHILPEIDTSLGISLALIHTRKGMQLFEKGKKDFVAYKVDYDRSLIYNSAINKSVRRPLERDAFFTDLKNLKWKEIKKKYARDKLKTLLKRKLSNSAIGKLRRILLRKHRKQKPFVY